MSADLPLKNVDRSRNRSAAEPNCCGGAYCGGWWRLLGGCAEIGIVLSDDTMGSSLGRSRSFVSGVGVVDSEAET
jgi:hypothetical protein